MDQEAAVALMVQRVELFKAACPEHRHAFSDANAVFCYGVENARATAKSDRYG